MCCFEFRVKLARFYRGMFQHLKKKPAWILAKQWQFQYIILHFFGRFLEPTIVAFITSIDSASQLVLGQIDKEASPKRAWGPVPGTQLIKLGKPEMRRRELHCYCLEKIGSLLDIDMSNLIPDSNFVRRSKETLRLKKIDSVLPWDYILKGYEYIIYL